MSEVINFPGTKERESEDQVPDDSPDTILLPSAEQLQVLFDPTQASGTPIGYLILIRTSEGNMRLGFGGEVGLMQGLGLLELGKNIWTNLHD
jgi:hypothetical protein